MPSKPKFSVGEVQDALERFGTNIGAAEALGCTDRTVSTYVKNHPELKQAAEQGKIRITQIAIGNLAAAVEAGDLNASKFWLTNSPSGKAEGFGKRQEISAAPAFDPAQYSPKRPDTWDEMRTIYKDIGPLVEIGEELEP